MYPVLRWFLFKFDPEKVHYFTFRLLGFWLKVPLVKPIWKSIYCLKNPLLETTVAGIKFPNPVGLAAGFDKNALRINELAACGFGFVEIGTVTPVGQEGNPKPRLFRLPQADAIINRMGFNNKGVDYLVENVKTARYKGVLGINIGKNKDTPNEQGKDDYVHCMRKVYPYASYITVNISSPNTPGLRDLQFGDPIASQIAQALEGAHHAVVSIGANGLSGYLRDIEIGHVDQGRLQAVLARRLGQIIGELLAVSGLCPHTIVGSQRR